MVNTADGSGALQEVALVSVQPLNGTAVQFAGIVEDISFGGGEKAIESIPLANGGRIVKRSPQSDHEITLKIYPVDIKSTSDLIQQFSIGTASAPTYDDSAPESVTMARGNTRFAVCVLWTEDATVTVAGATTGASKTARRYWLREARITNYAPSWSDKIVSSEVTFKAPAFSYSGTATLVWDSNENGTGAGLGAITSYTTGL
jgi:hypothetical protein